MVIWTLGNFLAQTVFAAGFVLKLGELLAKLQLQIVIIMTHGRPWRVDHSIMLNVSWWHFDQSAKQLIVGHTPMDDIARLVKYFKNNSYLFILPSVAYDPEGWQIRSITKLYTTLFIYLWYEYSKRFVQPVVQLRLYNRLWNVDILATSCTTGCTTGFIRLQSVNGP